jgi:hypothetical protein
LEPQKPLSAAFADRLRQADIGLGILLPSFLGRFILAAPSNHTPLDPHRIKRGIVFDWKSEKDVCRQEGGNNPQNATDLPIVRP